MRNQKLLFWLPLIVISIIFFFTQSYPDFVGLARLSFDLLDYLFHGRFIDYYNSMEWLYGIWVYLLYALWELPVYLVFAILKIPFSELEQVIPALLWIKVLPAGAGVISIFTFRKLSSALLKKPIDIDISSYIYASSLFVVLPVLGTATCDIVYIPFIQMGIYNFLKEKNREFLICFAFANSGKLLALFIFLPLLFYRDKKITALIKNGLGALSLIILDRILLLPSLSANIGREKTGSFFQYLLSYKIPIGGGGIHVLPFLFGLLCLHAFLRKGFPTPLRGHESIWLGGLGITLFFLFGGHHSQWCVLMGTFLPLLCMFSEGFKMLCIFLLSLFESLFVFRECFMLTWVFAGWGAFESLILKNFGHQNIRGQNAVTYFFDYVLESAAPYTYMTFLYTFLLVLFVALFAFSFPKEEFVAAASEEEQAKGFLPLLAFRTLLPAAYWLYTFIILIWL